MEIIQPEELQKIYEYKNCLEAQYMTISELKGNELVSALQNPTQLAHLSDWAKHSFDEHLRLVDDLVLEWRRAGKRAMHGDWRSTDLKAYDAAKQGCMYLADAWVLLSQIIAHIDEQNGHVNAVGADHLLMCMQEMLFVALRDLLQQSFIVRMPQELGEDNVELLTDPPLVIEKGAVRNLTVILESLCCHSDLFREYVLMDDAELTIIQGPLLDTPMDMSHGLTEQAAFNMLTGQINNDWFLPTKLTLISDKHKQASEGLTLKTSDNTPHSVTFDNLKVDGSRVAPTVERKQISKFSKYHFLAHSNYRLIERLTSKQQDGPIPFATSTISLPFLFTSAKNQLARCTMRMFWSAITTPSGIDSTACPEQEINPEEASVHIDTLLHALRALFFKLTRARPPSNDEMHCLRQRLETLTIGDTQKIARCALDQPGRLTHPSTEKPLNFSFFDWYYAAADLIIDQRGDLGKKPSEPPKSKGIKKLGNMAKFYRDGLIQGFVDQTFSYRVLQATMNQYGIETMVFRFSGTRMACLAIDPYNGHSIAPIAKDHEIGATASLPKYVLSMTNESVKRIQSIYTGRQSDISFGPFESIKRLTGDSPEFHSSKNLNGFQYEPPFVRANVIDQAAAKAKARATRQKTTRAAAATASRTQSPWLATAVNANGPINNTNTSVSYPQQPPQHYNQYNVAAQSQHPQQQQYGTLPPNHVPSVTAPINHQSQQPMFQYPPQTPPGTLGVPGQPIRSASPKAKKGFKFIPSFMRRSSVKNAPAAAPQYNDSSHLGDMSPTTTYFPEFHPVEAEGGDLDLSGQTINPHLKRPHPQNAAYEHQMLYDDVYSETSATAQQHNDYTQLDANELQYIDDGSQDYVDPSILMMDSNQGSPEESVI